MLTILNILILLFLIGMAVWWAGQGMLSGLLHLVLTVIAGLFAFIFWEWLVYGLLLDLVPEYAWGLGLLVPFAVTLLVLRTLFDKTIIGNLGFHNVADKIGGGVFGLLSGILTAGLLVIGLQMSGVPYLMDYTGWRLDDSGRPERSERLWVSVDSMTSNFFAALSGGAFAPILSDGTLPRAHPDLAVEASFFTQSPFPDSRRTIRPDDIRIPEDGYFRLNEAPPALAEQIEGELGAQEQLLVLGVTVVLQPSDPDADGAADYGDGTFRIARPQVALVCEAAAGVQTIYPIGYIQNGQYRPITLISGDYAYSESNVPDVTHYWVFGISADLTPRFLRYKQSRIELPAGPSNSPERLGSIVKPPEVLAAAQSGVGGESAPTSTSPLTPRQGLSSVAAGRTAEVSDSLPWLNSNTMVAQGATVRDNALVNTNGLIRITADSRGGSLGRNLAVTSINHPENARIVKVHLGSTNEGNSLLGRIFNMVTANTQAPHLVAGGQTFFANGYMIMGGDQLTMLFDPGRPIRSLSEIDLGRVRREDEVTLLFVVPVGRTITEFNLGSAQSQELNLTVQ